MRSDGDWKSLPPGQRQAWEALGWTAASWAGGWQAPVTELQTWSELTRDQQAAAAYGLGYSEQTWDKELDEAVPGDSLDTVASRESAPRNPASTSGGTSFFKKVLRVVRPAISIAKAVVAQSPLRNRQAIGEVLDAVSAMDDNLTSIAQGGSIKLMGVEDVVYLDDSGSMRLGTRLASAQALWSEMAELMQSTPTRIVKFGGTKRIVMPRVTEGFLAVAATANWDGSSGSTFMWQMILSDICDTYAPGPGRLRVFVFTDGNDTDSPPPYRGMQGMDPMMRDLRAKGYDVEFHIVFVSDVVTSAVTSTIKKTFGIQEDVDTDLRRYHDLALATGGGFFHLGIGSSRERHSFLDRLRADPAGRSDAAFRLDAQQRYEERIQIGEGTRFDWYKPEGERP